MRTLILALGLIASPVMAADQFDLICTGDDETWHYRVDLQKGEWCAGSCATTFKVASVTSGTIVLRNEEPQFRGGDTVVNSINRVSGEWYFYRSLPSIRLFETINGQCEVAAYSGMPTPKF